MDLIQTQKVGENLERDDMAGQSHVSTSSSMITQCDPNPAYGLTVQTHTQTSETEAGNLVRPTGSSSVAVNCQIQRPPAGDLHTVGVNELQPVYEWFWLGTGRMPQG